MTTCALKREKIILLLIMILSSLFLLGCNSHGKGDETIIRYEFCPGKYYESASVQQSQNMFYYAVNQSEIQGSAVYDTANNPISGSAFNSPLNISDENNGSWIADGFCRDVNNQYPVGTYTLSFTVKSINYTKQKYMEWVNFPNWKSTPVFDTSAVNDQGHRITITHSGITNIAANEEYSVRYRIKVYVNINRSSQLYGQSASSNAGVIDYSLPKATRSVELIPILVAELHKGGQIEKILFYPGQPFTYNP